MRYEQHANPAAGEQPQDLASAAANLPKRLTRATAAAFSAGRKSSDTEESNTPEDADKEKGHVDAAAVVEKTKKAPNDTMSRQINRVLFQLTRKLGICVELL